LLDNPYQRCWISINASPISTDGKPSGAVVEFSDVTGIYNLRNQLMSERNFINAIFETAGALIMVFDRNFHFVRFNKACERLTGYSSAEVMGQSLCDMFLPEEERGDIKKIERKLLSGEKVIEFENHWVKKSGKKIYTLEKFKSYG
jgi:PAS domain S-box